jgi:hypothetical protein
MKIRIGKLKKYFLTKVIGSLEIYFSKVGRLCAENDIFGENAKRLTIQFVGTMSSSFGYGLTLNPARLTKPSLF